jgi:hypothetical protein
MAVDSYGSRGEPKFSDSGAPDIAVDPTKVAEYARFVGNRITGTTAQRNAFNHPDWPHLTTPWEGLVWYDTTLDREFLWTGSGWKPTAPWGAFVNRSTDPTFGLITVNHPLGVTPDWVVVSPADTGSDAVSLILGAVVWTRDPSGVEIRFRHEGTHTWVIGTPVRFYVSMGVN